MSNGAGGVPVPVEIEEQADWSKIYFAVFGEIVSDFDDPWLRGERPLLAHYTSMQTASSILQNSELWFSNPLFMNDLEEMNYGITLGANHFLSSQEVVEACGSIERAESVKKFFAGTYESFAQMHALDVYVACFSEHDSNDTDGKLSMWRAYGAKGNGAAIIFDTSKIEVNHESPIIISKFKYWHRDLRLRWVVEKISKWCRFVAHQNYDLIQLQIAAVSLFEIFKLFALVTKHHGFSEEAEWRAIYLSNRDNTGLAQRWYSYNLSNDGVQPKLKFPLKPMNGVTDEEFFMDNIVKNIILGPTASSALARASFIRMLQQIGKGNLGDRVLSSTIPLRPNS